MGDFSCAGLPELVEIKVAGDGKFALVATHEDKGSGMEFLPPKDPQAIAHAIKEVYANYSGYKKGISKYRKEASWGVSAKKHVDYYKSILNKNRAI